MISPKEEFKKRAMLVGNKNYLQLFNYFVKLLRKTRLPYLKHNGFFISSLQIIMLKTLSKWQKYLHQIKKDISRTTPEKEKNILEQKLLIYTEWIRIFQTIADGIAWRNLKFNRPLIRLFSENKSPGFINEDYINIFQKYLSRMSGFVIINDLTRCLRISDLTQILPNNKVFLYEIKKSGSVLKDIGYVLKEMKKHKRFFSNQERKQWVAQSAIIGKKIEVPIYQNGRIKEELRAEIIYLDFPIQTHFSTIKKLIKKADNNGYALAELEPGYFIEISAYDEITKRMNSGQYIQYKKAQFEQNAPEWYKNKKNKIITLSNYDSFLQEGGHYPRNFLPYSVLPFSIKDCVRLMMGCLYLRIYFNLDIFERKIKEAGWVVKKEEKDSIFFKKQRELYKKEYQEKGSIYKYKVDESLYHLSRNNENGTYETSILTTQILIMLTSMYKTDFLVDEINYLYSEARKIKPERRTITINYLGEQKTLV